MTCRFVQHILLHLKADFLSADKSYFAWQTDRQHEVVSIGNGLD
jgi:hypothetical protein